VTTYPARQKLSFSNAPGRRASILVELEGRPQFAINFLDFSAVEETAGRPVKTLKRTGEALARSGSARQAREAWREALEERARARR
jgi:predicted negative regulator of RcsB-dependent stress response